MKNKLYVAVHLLALRDNSVLLLLRNNTGYEDGNYGVVAGHVEAGESASQSMIREAKEEANITPLDLKPLCVMHRKSETRESIDYFFVTRDWLGEIKNLEPHKCSVLTFFPIGNLPHNTIPYIKLGIENLTNNQYFIEQGW